MSSSDDRRVLLELFRETEGPSWKKNDGWDTNASISTWHGVTVDGDGRVVKLELSSNRLKGAIPESLGQLSNLTTLVLASNQLWNAIPESLGQLDMLTTLDLSWNHMRGAIPESFGQLTNLNIMYLQENQLSGAIPNSLGQLSKLEMLYFNNNQLSGAIPESLGQLSNVQVINFSFNQLSGAIPNSLGQLRKLDHLNLFDNHLSGSIPESLGQLPNLDRLYLANNQLSGTIPESLGLLPNLVLLDLFDNQLSGAIPESLGQLPNLDRLYLANNQLSGAIPESFGLLPNLVLLDLFDNQLSGAIPESLGQLPNVQIINLANNQLSGAIPESLGQLPNLDHLYLANNQLSGAIPESLGLLPNLVLLDLFDNQLSGAIPKALGKLSNLNRLNLAKNLLSGAIPESLGQLPNLDRLYLANNQLSGTIPESFGLLPNLVLLDLFDNQLSGTIPESLGKLPNAQIINLANNQLSGAIPESLGQLPNLDHLYLANNQLSGGNVDANQQGSWTKRITGDDISTSSKKMDVETTIMEGKGIKEHPRSAEGSLKEGKTGEQSGKLSVPEDKQEQPAAGETTQKPEFDESSKLGKNGAVLAERLGTQAAVFFNSSFGVELTLEENSLEQEIMGKTHDELLTQGLEQDFMELEDNIELLVMPIVHGPSEAKFKEDKPAKLRFFAGYLGDLQNEIQEESEDDGSSDIILEYLRAKYEPLISADGENWMMLQPFNVVFKNGRGGETEIWLEMRMYHFSVGSIGEVLPKGRKHLNFEFFEGRMPWRMRFFGHNEDVLFGNATEEDDLVYYACKKGNILEYGQRKEVGAGGMGFEVAGATEYKASTANHGIDDVIKHEVHNSTYRTVEMFKDGKAAHDQMLFAVFLRKAKNLFFLKKQLLSKRKMYVVLPKMAAKWRDGVESTAEEKLVSTATPTMVKDFLLDHL